ncbi:MAG: ComF family protein [Phycisphaerae bacterium]|nr:ComF family protein [Phycisphaerae bacterium]
MMRFSGEMFRGLAAVGRDVWSGAVDLLLPNVCGGCEDRATPRGQLCDACGVKLLALIALPYCPRCGATLGPNVRAYPDGCGACPSPLPRFGRVFRLGPYAPPLRNVIRRLKFYHRLGLAKKLCEMLAERIAAEGDGDLSPDVIVPVPAFWLRRFSRGLDHAALLAEHLARELSLPIGEELLRVRNTPQQAQLSRTQRFASVRGAFRTADASALRGARVLLVDDVTTTGATAGECARTLLQAGVTSVQLAVLAKAEAPTAYTQHWET